jgi:hypothetical protein
MLLREGSKGHGTMSKVCRSGFYSTFFGEWFFDNVVFYSLEVKKVVHMGGFLQCHPKFLFQNLSSRWIGGDHPQDK